MPTILAPLLQLQLGKETTWGTPVNPTAKLDHVEAAITPRQETALIAVRRGNLAPSFQEVMTRTSGEARIRLAATYEDICYLLDSLFSAATPTGAGPYTRTYAAPLTAAATPRYNTIVLGTSDMAARLEGGVAKSLTIGLGRDDAVLRAEATFIGEVVSSGTLAALSDRATNPVTAPQAALYIDTWTGTIGTTAVPCTLEEFELVIESNRQLRWCRGSALPTEFLEGRWDATLTLGMALTGSSNITKTIFEELYSTSAAPKRQIRVGFANGASLDLRFDFAGVLQPASVFEEVGGITRARLVWKGLYNSTLGNFLKAQSINNVSALP